MYFLPPSCGSTPRVRLKSGFQDRTRVKVSPSFWFTITLLPGQRAGSKASTLHYLTLEQALNQKKVVVHETSQVNELAVENTSADAVFIQVGDIVKGGNQDRMITNDFILPPHSGKLPIAAFCVDQGRLVRRGSEPAQGICWFNRIGFCPVRA